MPTRPQWKFAEDWFAAFFGTRRRPLSGGNQGGGRDDSMHESLFLESKYGKNPPLFPLFEETRDKAKTEGKTPVIGLRKKNKKGFLLVIHSEDFPTVVVEYLKAQGLSSVITTTVRSFLANKRQLFKANGEANG